MVKKKTNKLIDKLSKFVPCDNQGNQLFVECCKNKKAYICKFPGEPIALVCKSHIKDKSLMDRIEKITNIELKKVIPLEDMGFEKESPNWLQTVEKVLDENKNIRQTESLCIRGIALGNRLIKIYKKNLEESTSEFGKDGASYIMWNYCIKLQELFVTDLCEILIRSQSKYKRTKS